MDLLATTKAMFPACEIFPRSARIIFVEATEVESASIELRASGTIIMQFTCPAFRDDIFFDALNQRGRRCMYNSNHAIIVESEDYYK